jgi:hypothetical protein
VCEREREKEKEREAGREKKGEKNLKIFCYVDVAGFNDF